MNPRPFEPGADFYNAHKAWSEKIFRKIRKQFLKSFKFDISNYGHLHPLMIMSVMANSVLESEHHISLDEHLWEYAKQNGKETLGLESFEEQYRILHSIDPMPLYRQILKISKRPASIRKNTAKGLNLYMEGNIHELYILSKSSMKDLRKKIIYKRNEKMASVIIGLNPEVKYFITVGAGHLSGKTGILSALKKEGWKVKPVRLMAGSQE